VLRGAFIGFGNVAARGHLPGWLSRNDVRIVAATDAIPARREAFLGACPDGRWYDSVDDLLSGEALDFVDVCTPPGSHASLIKRALDARLHVLCEKPLVTRVGDAQMVAAAAASAGRIVHTVHNWLKAPICLKISALIAEGEIGVVRSVDWRTLRNQPAVSSAPESGNNWRVDPAQAGGGILFDHGWHALYCIVRWAGPPRAIAALLETRRFHEWPLEDTATLNLNTSFGVSHIYLTWTATERSNHIEIEGDRGRITVVNDTVIVSSNSSERRWACPPSLSEGSHHPDWFLAVAEDFRIAATGGDKGNMDEAVLCARLIDLAQRSAARGAQLLFND
jgi:predicted dehydrogenase